MHAGHEYGALRSAVLSQSFHCAIYNHVVNELVVAVK